MTGNVAEDIRAKEAEAREIISGAKREAARLTAAARTIAEQSVKEAKQKSHRYFREQVKNAEAEAEQNAVKLVGAGKADADVFYNSKQASSVKAAEWLFNEVVATNGID